MKIFQIFNLFSLLEILYSQGLYLMSQEYQIDEQTIDLNNLSIKEEYKLFGIWSRYNPLGITQQIGLVGLMNSNCFHYQSIIGKSSNSLEQIYYDCLYSESKTIQKYVTFNTKDGQQHIYKIEINPSEYENVWYLFELFYFPSNNILEFIIVKENQILIKKKIDTLLFQENEVKLTMGGSLINSKIQSIEAGAQFSYFPGKLYQILQSYSSIQDYIFTQGIIIFVKFFDDVSPIICEDSITYKIQDQDLFQGDQKSYISEKTNTDSFILTSWFRIIKIHQVDEEFTYQFFKMSKNTKFEQLSNLNLSPFQLSYRISPNNNKIIITTYSYNYPSVTLDFTNIDELFNFLGFSSFYFSEDSFINNLEILFLKTLYQILYIKQPNSKKFQQFISSDNSFIINEEFEITHRITLWHRLFVNLISDQIYIEIKFFDQYEVYEYSASHIVKQFRFVKFQIQYGNLMKSGFNYLDIQTRNTIFYNCQKEIEQQNCHFSCLDCDGPTNTDCLSCSEASQRIYILEYKACICPYNYLDDQTNQNCISFSDLSFDIQDLQKDNHCKFGYFEFDDSCSPCPSIISDKLITCLECLQNGKGWKDQAYCQTEVNVIPNGKTARKEKDTSPLNYFLFDGLEPYFCRECIIQQFSNIDSIFQIFSYLQQKFNSFCQAKFNAQIQGLQIQICYECNLEGCATCSIEITGIICIICQDHTPAIDGFCRVIKLKIIYTENVIGKTYLKGCRTPYYLNSLRECKLCPIEYCKYCFEYKENDLYKSTLYANFEIFELDEYLNIGCALCEIDFIFDFTIRKCIYKQTSLPNCLRNMHFIVEKNGLIYLFPFMKYLQEKLLNIKHFILLGSNKKILPSQPLSSTDFSVALEIINCDKFIENCLQCVLTPWYEVKCIICQVGFTTSVVRGDCYPNALVNANVVIDGDKLDYDAWIQRIQSFMMKFLQNNYFYYRDYAIIGDQEYQIQNYMQYEIECKEGYFANKYFECVKYCTSDCLNCLEDEREDQFYCAQCPLNYYYSPILTQIKGQCTRCPELCEVCEERSEAEIQKLNPYFRIKNDNRIYSYKCIRPILNQNVVIEPYFQISKYCFTPNCNLEFTYKQSTYYINSDDKIDIHYCNQIGVQVLKFSINRTTYMKQLSQITELKSKIFSLQFLKTELHLFYQTTSYGVFSGFDSIQINNAKLEINTSNFQFQNQNQKVDFILNNILIEQNQINNINSLFDSELFGDITLNNISIINSNFSSSSLLNLNQKLQQGTIKILKLTLQNCNIVDSQLFKFLSNQVQIQIEQLVINQTLFSNSSFITFFQNVNDESKLEIKRITITSSQFLKSFFFNCTNLQDININNFILDQNSLIQSTIIAFNKNFILFQTQVNNNNFIESQLIKSLETESKKKIHCFVDNYLAIQNNYINSSLFQISIENMYYQLRSVRMQLNQGQTILEILNIQNNNQQKFYQLQIISRYQLIQYSLFSTRNRQYLHS